MQNRFATILAPLLASVFAACVGSADTSSSTHAIIDSPCASDTDCPTGFQCEVETEHGVTSSFCQAEDEDTQCPAGYELEVEHGQEYCKPHGGSGNGGGSGSGSGSDDAGGAGSGSDDTDGGTGTTGSSCTTSADCAAGLECETQVEGGVTTSTCKPHGA